MKMKYLLLSLVLLSGGGLTQAMSSVSTGVLEQTPVKNETPAKTYVQPLNTQDFLVKVHDYNENPSVWKYKGEMPCIIDFYADWCRPCRMFAPVLEKIAAQYDGKIVVYKVNVDKESQLSSAFDIKSIPSILFVPMEGNPSMQSGMLSEEQMHQAVKTILLGEKAE